MLQPAIKYKFFVKTRKTTAVIKWTNKHAKGSIEQDTGGWRDYALKQERGFEFELLNDAKQFIFEHGGELSCRYIK